MPHTAQRRKDRNRRRALASGLAVPFGSVWETLDRGVPACTKYHLNDLGLSNPGLIRVEHCNSGSLTGAVSS